jgi:PPOX class probable F420-dependent enzyme
MSDPKVKLERKAKRLTKKEYIVWLTTVNSDLTPQPRPVWFIWDNDSFLIFSQPKAHKIRHIKQNASVSVHFNTDETGDTDVVVYIGKAVIDSGIPPAHKVPAYFRKYRKGIKELGMTPEKFSSEYSIAIRVTPTSLRGW